MTRYVGAFFLLTAAVIGIHTVVEPLYHTTTMEQPFSPLWTYLNYWTALAMILGLRFSCIRKCGQSASDQAVTRDWVESSAQFYGFIVVGILFFWNWFALLNDSFSTIGDDTSTLVWIVVDVGVVVLCGSLGMHLWRSSKAEE